MAASSPDIYQHIANKIKHLREEKDIPQKALAAEIGKSVVTISNYEKCKRQIPIGDLIKLANALEEPLMSFISSSSSSSSNKVLFQTNEIINGIEEDFEKLDLMSFCKIVTEKITLKLNLQFVILTLCQNTKNDNLQTQIYSLRPLVYSTDIRLEKKILPLIRIFENTSLLNVSLKSQAIKLFKSEGVIILNNESEIRNFLKNYIPHWEILTPVIPDIFGKTTWILIPQIKTNRLEGVLVVSCKNSHIPPPEKISALMLLKTYIWKCLNCFGNQESLKKTQVFRK